MVAKKKVIHYFDCNNSNINFEKIKVDQVLNR